MIGLIISVIVIIFIIGVAVNLAKSLLPIIFGGILILIMLGVLVWLLINYTWTTVSLIALLLYLGHRENKKIYAEFDDLFRSEDCIEIQRRLSKKSPKSINSILKKYKSRLHDFGFNKKKIELINSKIITLQFIDFSDSHNNAASKDRIIYSSDLFYNEFSEAFPAVKDYISIDFLNRQALNFGFRIEEPKGADIIVISEISSEVGSQSEINLDDLE